MHTLKPVLVVLCDVVSEAQSSSYLFENEMAEATDKTVIKHRCANPGCKAVAKNKCGHCQTHYCSRECQKAHWPVHKPRCKPVPTMKEYKEITGLPESELQKTYNMPLFHGKPSMFLPKPAGPLPAIMRDLDDPKVRQALGITAEQAPGVKGLCVIRGDEYFEAMRLLTPEQKYEITFKAKMHALFNMEPGTWEHYFDRSVPIPEPSAPAPAATPDSDESRRAKSVSDFLDKSDRSKNE